MKPNRLISLVITALILINASLTTIAHSETAGTFRCYSFERLGLLIEVEVTGVVWPRENITVSIKAVATQANIHIRFVHVNVSSLKESRNKTLLSSTSFFEDTHLSLGSSRETSYIVSVPEDTLPGLLYGEVWYKWSVEGDNDVSNELNAFPATYIQNKPYEDLRQDYEALNSFFNDLQANYTDLDEKYQQLAGGQIAQNNATGLMYLFLITTGIFVVTTILLLIRRPKTTTW